MNILMLAVTVFALASCSTAGGPVQVTNQTLANHSASSPYVIDLTSTGDTYDVAGDIDYSRVRIRTDLPMEDFIRQRGGKAGQRVLLGDLSDLVVLLPPDSDGGVAAECSFGGCTCKGRKDCSDLSKSGKCKSGPNSAACGQGYGGGSGWGCTCDKK
jgi:hypothetical protein